MLEEVQFHNDMVEKMIVNGEELNKKLRNEIVVGKVEERLA